MKFSGNTPLAARSLFWSQFNSFTPSNHPSSCSSKKAQNKKSLYIEFKTIFHKFTGWNCYWPVHQCWQKALQVQYPQIWGLAHHCLWLHSHVSLLPAIMHIYTHNNISLYFTTSSQFRTNVIRILPCRELLVEAQY